MGFVSCAAIVHIIVSLFSVVCKVKIKKKKKTIIIRIYYLHCIVDYCTRYCNDLINMINLEN